MVDVSEVVVRATPEGIDATVDELDQMEDSVEDSTDAMGEQASEMGDFSKRFQGAITTAAVGLAIGSAALLSRVPVIGEAMSGLFAIVDALAFQMDGVLRPILSPLGDLFLWISDQIFEADGAFGSLIGIVSSAIAVLAGIFGVMAPLVGTTAAWAATFGKVGAVIKAALVPLAAFLGVSLLALGAIFALVAGLGLLIWFFRDEIRAALGVVVDGFWGFIDTLRTIVPVLFTFGVDMLKSFVEGFRSRVSNAVTAITSFIGSIGDRFTDLASDAFEWGVSLVQGLLGGILSLAETVVEAFQGVINGIIGTINRALNVLPDEVTSRVGVDQFDRVDFSSELGRGSSGGGDSGGFIGSVGGGGGGTYLDGRRVDDNQGRFRKDSLTRRGG